MEELTTSQETALCLLITLDEMLTGEHKPRKPDEERVGCVNRLISFIRTGKCLAREEDLRMLDEFRQWRESRYSGRAPDSDSNSTPLSNDLETGQSPAPLMG
jgi:hypothetical protein